MKKLIIGTSLMFVASFTLGVYLGCTNNDNLKKVIKSYNENVKGGKEDEK